MLVSMDGVRLITDPVFRGRVAHLRRTAAVREGDAPAVDGVLLSHAHYDHLDPPSLRRLGRNTRILAPAGSDSQLRRRGFDRVETMALGEGTARFGGVTVRATAAEHLGHRRGRLGGRSEAIGFLIEGSHRIYFAGDTDLFPAMADLGPGLDLALVPVWGWGPSLGPGHMDPERAAESLRLLRPRVAVPIHWGTYYLIGSGGPSAGYVTRPAAEFRGHARRLAPEVTVRILRPGASMFL